MLTTAGLGGSSITDDALCAFKYAARRGGACLVCAVAEFAEKPDTGPGVRRRCRRRGDTC